jgi:hypothetical protein
MKRANEERSGWPGAAVYFDLRATVKFSIAFEDPGTVETIGLSKISLHPNLKLS